MFSSKAAEADAEASSSRSASEIPMDNKIQTDRPGSFDASPPPFYGDQADDELINDEILARLASEAPHVPPFGGIPLPIVIPQTTKASGGAYFSPFVRAYVSGLEAHGIKKEEFVTFVDGLNEAFIPNPVDQYAGVLGQIMSLFEQDEPMQWLATGISIFTGGRTQAICYAQTKTYLKAMNADLFHPAGLHINIMSTAHMMKKVNFPQDKLQLPRLDSFDDLQYDSNTRLKDAVRVVAESTLPQDDPRMRRIRALEGYVMPLDFDVPEVSMPEDLVRRMGAGRAVSLAKSQEKQLTKRRARGVRMYMRAERRQNRDEARIVNMNSRLNQRTGKPTYDQLEQKLGKVTLSPKATWKNEKELEEEQDDVDDDDDATLVGSTNGDGKYPSDRRAMKLQRKVDRRIARSERRVDRQIERAERKHTRNEKREHDIAGKILWLVISPWDGTEKEESSDEENDLPKGDPPPEPLEGDVQSTKSG